jgi:transmembrane sensor
MSIRVTSRWNEAREEAAARGIAVRWRRRRIAKRAALAGGLVAAAALASWIALDEPAIETAVRDRPSKIERPVAEPRAEEPRLQRIVFADGSTAEHTGATLELEADSRERISVRIGGGSARFDVVRNEARAFEVVSPHATVRVVGTIFTVRVDEAGARTRVDVARGHVVVTSRGEPADLREGQGDWFPRATAETARAEPERRERSWVALAREERFEDAYDALRASGGSARGADELWLAADSARRSGHAREAVPYLERLVNDHGSDGRAPLAAFTLGRVELGLGRDGRAADAFARARALAPSGSLAQDALAREIMSRSRAGQSDRARRLGLEYLERYPNGRRSAEVRRIVGE